MSRRAIAGARALITGASGGIGLAIALELARQQARVLLLARRGDKLAEAERQLAALGAEAAAFVGDITDPAARAGALALARERFGGLDILINNAAVGRTGRFRDADPRHLRRIFEVNFFAAAELIRESLPILERGRRPIVVNVGSILGHRAVPRHAEYCASKFALRGLSESIAPELAKLGVDLLLVTPGTTDTDFHEHSLERQGELPWTSRRGAAPSAVAKATVAGIKRGRTEIVPSVSGRLLYLANRLSPRLVDRWMRRYG